MSSTSPLFLETALRMSSERLALLITHSPITILLSAKWGIFALFLANPAENTMLWSSQIAVFLAETPTAETSIAPSSTFAQMEPDVLPFSMAGVTSRID